MTVGEALRHGVGVLRAAGVENPGLDARLLLGHALGLDQTALLGKRGAEVAVEAFGALLSRRATREPIALILGRQEFWSLDFAVSPATLIPRADSEALIEALVAARPERGRIRRVLDLGTGTGCLLLAALSEFGDAWGLGVDVSPAAAALAASNAERLGFGSRASFLAGDWAAALVGRFDVVLSNPPYVRSSDILALMPEVSRYESRRALDGGPDGLAAYRALLGWLPGLLTPDGVAVFELSAGQAAAVSGIAAEAGYESWSRFDYGGVERALVLQTQENPATTRSRS